LVIYHIYRIYL